MKLFVCFTLVIALFAGFILAADPQCSYMQLTCVPGGGNCTSDQSQCDSGFFCDYSKKVGNDYICQPVVKIGGSCSSDMACIDHDLGTSYCVNGICSATTFTGTAGQNCSTLNRCSNKFYCSAPDPFSTGVCVKLAQKGEKCDIINCDLGLACNIDVCIPAFSIAAGGKCDRSASLFGVASTVCTPGLYCHPNGTCVAGFSSSNASCASSPCANKEESCICDNNQEERCTAPETLTKLQANEVSALQVCEYNSSCTVLDPSCCNAQQCVLYDLIFSKELYLFSCETNNPYHSC